tara:strand:- start:885 stop:1193 length:309 start_codon:yes stop_codon:yes gene_type:complete
MINGGFDIRGRNSNVVKFKYRIVINKKTGEQQYILPKDTDFNFVKLDLNKITLFDEEGDNLENLIKNKLKKLKQIKGGSRNMRKTTKNNKNIKNKTLRNNRI